MSDINNITLLGRLGRDPDLQTFGSGNKVTLRLASSESWKNKQTGEKVEETCWVDAVAWNGLADVLHRYLAKGDQVLVTGRLVLDEWEKDGQKRSKHYIKIRDFSFVGGKNDGQKQAGGQGYGRQASQGYQGGGGQVYGRQAASTQAAMGVADSDLPF